MPLLENLTLTTDSTPKQDLQNQLNDLKQFVMPSHEQKQSNQSNPYLDSPYNPRNHVNTDRTKWGDALFNKGFNVTKEEEKQLYGQKRGDQMFKEGIAYVVAKEGILNVPDDILMLVQDVMSLTEAGLDGKGLLFKYTGARRNADSNPVAKQDLAWLNEAHPLLGLLSAISSRSTVASIISQFSVLGKGDGTAKNRGDMINMIGGLVYGGGSGIKGLGKLAKAGAKATGSARLAKAGVVLESAGTKILNVGGGIDPLELTIKGGKKIISKAKNLVSPKLKNATVLGNIDAQGVSVVGKSDDVAELDNIKNQNDLSTTSNNTTFVEPESIKITNESELSHARQTLDSDVAKGSLTLHERGVKIGYVIAPYILALREGKSWAMENVTTMIDWINKQDNRVYEFVGLKKKKVVAEIETAAINTTEAKFTKILTAAEHAELKKSITNLDTVESVMSKMIILGKIADSWYGFEGLLGFVPTYLIKIIPGINLLPIEASTSLIYAITQYKYARKIGMNSKQIKLMMINQAKDAGISMAGSGISMMTGGWLLGSLNPLQWIFGMSDFKFKANKRNAQQFIEFYGQEIEKLKSKGASSQQLASHQARYDQLVDGLPQIVKNQETILQITNKLNESKNINEYKIKLEQLLPDNIAISGPHGVEQLNKKIVIKRIDEYLEGTIGEEYVPIEYGVREMAFKLKSQAPKSQTVRNN